MYDNLYLPHRLRNISHKANPPSKTDLSSFPKQTEKVNVLVQSSLLKPKPCLPKTYLMVMQFPPHHPECVVHCMLVYLHFGEPGRGAAGHPFLVHVIVGHHICPCPTYWHLTEKEKTVHTYNTVKPVNAKSAFLVLYFLSILSCASGFLIMDAMKSKAILYDCLNIKN